MGAVGKQMMGFGVSNISSKSNVNFINFVNELEDEINETRKDLNFCKKEVEILRSEQNTVAEMADCKCLDIGKYLSKEIHYLEELIGKAQTK